MSDKRRGYKLSEPQPNAKRPRSASRSRGNDADYYGPSADVDDDNGGWDCTECGAWNRHRYSDGTTPCDACGVYPSSQKSVEQDKDSDLDEFGRRRPPPAPPAPAWPPNFETNGSKYVLDNRSGMFYEAESKFFYDPTTKLYYSHQKQAYFRHRLAPNGKSLFDKVEHELTESSVTATTTTTDADKHMSLLPAISINLKTKSLHKKAKKKKDHSAETKQPVLPAATRKTKEHEADLAKWSERQTERKVERDLSKIPKTSKGEPICSLCKRKFPTLDKLFYHEKVSQLHKSNLAKQASEQKVVATDEKKPAYVDRAEQRRLLQGPDTLVSAPVQTGLEASLAATAAVVDPKETLNEANIGNKMLQKLGWQQGKSLGRRTTEGSNQLEQDWERIERLAASNGSNRK